MIKADITAMQPFYAVKWDTEEPAVRAVSGIIESLATLGWVGNAYPPEESSFCARFRQISRFRTHQTSFTPLCLRLLYGLGYAHRGVNLLGIGTGDGLALAALTAGASDRHSGAPVQAMGVDTSQLAVEQARRNAEHLSPRCSVGFCRAEGVGYLAAFDGPIDLLLLDAECPVKGKGIYIDLLQPALARLTPGAVVLAHDALTPKFSADLQRYASFVHAVGLEGPLNIPIGAGWSLAIRTHRSTHA